MPRPRMHSLDLKLKVVLSVLSGESSQAEAARRHGVSETSIGKWREQFIKAGREGLEHGDRAGKPTAVSSSWWRRLTSSPVRSARRTSSCVRSSAAARP
jgi:transposase-like protein